jgi:type I restriction enzyme S subunit
LDNTRRSRSYFLDVTQAADVIGKPALVQPASGFSTLVASLDVGIVRPHRPELPVPYLYYCFLDSAFQEHTYAHANGSTVLHLASGAIEKYVGVWPSPACAEAFTSRVQPLLDLQKTNWSQSSTLGALRDLLLPKLISGDLRIHDAERAIESVA